MTGRRVTRLGCLLAAAVMAPAAARAEGATHIGYAVYAAGLNVLKLQSDVDIEADRYRVDLNYRTTGLLSAVVSSSIESFAQGSWQGTQPMPLRFGSWGQLRGDNRRTRIDYVGGQPQVKELEPAIDEGRDPVPVAQQRDSVDTLSAMAMMVRQVATTGRCDGKVKTFDGRRLSEITATTGGMETLAAESRSSFAGPALRCDLAGVQLGGFLHDTSEEELHKIHRSTAWLAPLVPGGPKLPVRVVFETNFFGHATAYVTDAAARGPIR